MYGRVKGLFGHIEPEQPKKKLKLGDFINNPAYFWNGPSANNFVVKNAPPTIRYIPNFITVDEEKFFLTQVYTAPKPKWQQLMNRRLQNWGGVIGKDFLIPDGSLPSWLKYVIDKVMALSDAYPPENRPNHVLINEYLPGQGIMAHTDGPAFYPNVTTISLGGDLLLDYYKPVDPKENDVKENRYLGSMLLERRSIVMLSGDAYEKYLHEIADRPFDVITNRIYNLEGTGRHVGEVMNRDLRVSLTIRNVPKVSKMSAADLLRKK